MRCARDARVVVADCLFEMPLQCLVVQMRPSRDEPTEILFDGCLVLRRGRHDLRICDQPGAVDLVPVVQQAARRLACPVTHGGARFDDDSWRVWTVVILDDPQ